jgi:hypothetical protein
MATSGNQRREIVLGVIAVILIFFVPCFLGILIGPG